MNKKEKKKKYYSLKAKNAVRILEQEIASIRYVKNWAVLVGCSKTKLNQLIRYEFAVSAKAMMKNIRFRKIKQTIEEHPNYGSFAVAKENGLENERELYKFLSRNFDTNFSELSFQIHWDEE